MKKIFYDRNGSPKPLHANDALNIVKNEKNENIVVRDDVLAAYIKLPALLDAINKPEYQKKATDIYNQIRALEEKKLKEFEQEIEQEEIDPQEKE